MLVYEVDRLATCNVADFDRLLPGQVEDPRTGDIG